MDRVWANWKVFLDRPGSFEFGTGKPVEVQGKRDRALTGSTESV